MVAALLILLIGTLCSLVTAWFPDNRWNRYTLSWFFPTYCEMETGDPDGIFHIAWWMVWGRCVFQRKVRLHRKDPAAQRIYLTAHDTGRIIPHTWME